MHKQRPATASQKPPLVKQPVRQSIDPKIAPKASVKPDFEGQDV